MDGGEGKVTIRKTYLVSVFGQDLLHGWFHCMAVRALVVGELHDHDRGVGVSTQARRIMSYLHARWGDHDGQVGTSSQLLHVILAGIAYLGIFEIRADRSFYRVERALDPVL